MTITNNMDAAQFLLELKRYNANAYLENRNYLMVQLNGQRISSFASIEPPKINKGHEVFVGKLPRDLYEDELLPFMEQAGVVTKLRLMIDFSGTTRGFGFVLYATAEEADFACKILNGTRIRENHHPICALPSFDNKRLYFGNLPPNCTKELLFENLKNVVDGVEDVDMPECSRESDRRYAYVKFVTHEAATQARRVLIPGGVKLCKQVITIDWAKRESPPLSRRPSPPAAAQSPRIIPFLHNIRGYCPSK